MLPARQIEQPIEPVSVISEGHDFRARVLIEYLSSKGLDRLPQDPRLLSDYRAFLEAKGYAPNTVSFCLSPVRQAYRVIGIETAKIIKGPRRSTSHLKDPVAESEMSYLLHYAERVCSLRDRAILSLMAYLGLREIEVSRLDVGDFFPQDGKWKLRLWGKGRAGKEDKMTVTNGLLDVMLQYRETVKDRKATEPMFKGKKGCRLRPDVISRIVRKIMLACAVKNEDNTHRITPHSIRHSAITKVLKETRDIRKAQKFGRHLDVRTTEIYLHDVEEGVEEVVQW